MRQRKRLFGGKSSESPKPRFTIENGCTVTLTYDITDDEGGLLDSTDGRGVFSYEQGSAQLLQGIQDALDGHEAGDKIEVQLPPRKAYGQYDEEKLQTIEKPLFDEDIDHLEEGMEFELATSDGLRIVTIKEVDDNRVVVDLNHPLAGKTLNVKATVVSVHPTRSELDDENLPPINPSSNPLIR